jgi:hypothetical protein
MNTAFISNSNQLRNILFITFFVFFIHNDTIAQNIGSKILKDSIYPAFQSGYEFAKKLLIKYEDQIIPQDMVFVLEDILSVGDTNFYKDRMTYLMKNYGWNYNYIETHSLSSLSSELCKNNMFKWTWKASQEYYPIWVKNNMEKLVMQEKFRAISHTDQSIRSLLTLAEDTTELKIISRMINQIDFNNLTEICNLSDENNGVLINDFDIGIAVYNNVHFILWHNLKSKENFQKSWDLILPYIEKAYFQKKIGSHPFIIYDTWSVNHFGYQYYGTFSDTVPVIDSLLLEKMKKKYQF